MSQRDRRTHPPPPELKQLVLDTLARVGTPAAVRELGVSRTSLLSVAAGLPVTRGTLALLELALQRSREDA